MEEKVEFSCKFDDEKFTLHGCGMHNNHDTTFNKTKAALLFIELYKFLGLSDSISENEIKQVTNSEKYLLVKFVDGDATIDGSYYADTIEGIEKHYNTLPKYNGIEYTICRINKIN